MLVSDDVLTYYDAAFAIVTDADDAIYVAYANADDAAVRLATDPVRTTTVTAQQMVAATFRLDLLRWRGAKTDEDQATQWPRTGMTFQDGSAIGTDIIPRELKVACAYLAGTIATTPEAANVAANADPIKRVRAGSAEVEYRRGARRGVDFPDPTAYALVRHWLRGSVYGLYPEAYGTGGETSFESGQYDRTDGFG